MTQMFGKTKRSMQYFVFENVIMQYYFFVCAIKGLMYKCVRFLNIIKIIFVKIEILFFQFDAIFECVSLIYESHRRFYDHALN